VGVAWCIRHWIRPIARAAGSPVEPERRQLPSIKPCRACSRAGSRRPEGSWGKHRLLPPGSRSVTCAFERRDGEGARIQALSCDFPRGLVRRPWIPTESAGHPPIPFLKSTESAPGAPWALELLGGIWLLNCRRDSCSGPHGNGSEGARRENLHAWQSSALAVTSVQLRLEPTGLRLTAEWLIAVSRCKHRT
jgi:hypothetical protein